MIRLLLTLFALFAIFFAENASASVRDLGARQPSDAVLALKSSRFLLCDERNAPVKAFASSGITVPTSGQLEFQVPAGASLQGLQIIHVALPTQAAPTSTASIQGTGIACFCAPAAGTIIENKTLEGYKGTDAETLSAKWLYDDAGNVQWDGQHSFLFDREGKLFAIYSKKFTINLLTYLDSRYGAGNINDQPDHSFLLDALGRRVYAFHAKDGKITGRELIIWNDLQIIERRSTKFSKDSVESIQKNYLYDFQGCLWAEVKSVQGQADSLQFFRTQQDGSVREILGTDGRVVNEPYTVAAGAYSPAPPETSYQPLAYQYSPTGETVTRASIRPDFAFRGMARVEDDFLLAPDGSLFHPKLGLPLNGLRSSNHGLEINKQAIDGLDTKTKMIIASPLIYLMPVAIGAGMGGREAWTSVGNYIATGESDYGLGDAAGALIGMVPFGATASTPTFAAAAAKAGAIGSKGLAGAREALNASRLGKAINCGSVAQRLERLGWVTTRCFPGDTLASGKRMDQYHKDELLTAWDDAKKAFVQARITQIFVHEHDGEFAEVTLTSGASLKPTAEHPFRLAQPEQLGARSAVIFDAPQEGTWVEARYLRTGDLLLTPKGAIAVASVRVYQDKIKVYNFEIEGLHNYTVGDDGVVVHNACNPRLATRLQKWQEYKAANATNPSAMSMKAWVAHTKSQSWGHGRNSGIESGLKNIDNTINRSAAKSSNEVLRGEFNSSIRSKFLADFAGSKRALELLNMEKISANELAVMSQGKSINGWAVHHLQPLYRGGNNSFDNLILLRDNFHRRWSGPLHNYNSTPLSRKFLETFGQ